MVAPFVVEVMLKLGSVAPVPEDAVSPRPYDASADDEKNAEQNLTLSELDDANNNKDRCDDPQQGAVHFVVPSICVCSS
jgi:hypothetical protein